MAIAAPVKDHAYSREDVVKIIRAALTSMRPETDMHKDMHKDLSMLADHIQNMRLELAQVHQVDVDKDHIPSATDELDMIVHETAKATGTILTSCEAIEKVAGTLEGEKQKQLQDAVTAVYEACAFQDITGQRVTKVVGALKAIERIVENIMAFQGPGIVAQVKSEKGDGLLNGPQLQGPAVSQDEIDKLLAGFDQ